MLPAPPVLTVRRAALREIRAHAESAYPLECCGVLLGTRSAGIRRAADVVRCANVRDEPARGYEIDPADLFPAVRRARERGQEIVGFYHSHPDGPARGSEADRCEALWFGCSYLVTAVAAGAAGETRSFLLAGDACAPRFLDEDLRVVP